MFKKPFKVKSQVQLKSSEKKKLSSDLKIYFPSLTDEDVSLFCNSKDNVSKLKLTTDRDEIVDVYMAEKVPIFFDLVDSNIQLPTVFMLWKCPHAVPMFTTNSFVFEKLKNGADLFLPGVITEGLCHSAGNFKLNDPAAVNLIDNKACVAVGYALIDRVDIFLNDISKQSGKAIKVFHTVGDHLFKLHPQPVLVKLGAPEWVLAMEKNESEKENVEDGAEQVEATNENDGSAPASDKLENNVVEVESGEVAKVLDRENYSSIEKNAQGEVVSDKDSEKNKMDQLLEYCFLKALKTANKNIYPILPATFYANHVLHSLPEGETLNIKKTKWKKFSAYLQEKSLEGIIKLQPMQKNEYSILGVITSHKRLQEFVDPYKTEPITVEPKTGSDGKPVVQQVFSVSANTLPFFSIFGFKKHDELTRNDVRTCLNDYIKRESLCHPTMMDKVVMDPILTQVVRDSGVLTRAEIISGLLDKMGVQHKISAPESGDTLVFKGKMPLIEFEVVMRTGNKKVTLISNVECYGVNVINFSKELQQKAAASTTTTPNVPGKKGAQIQVQGNQILIAANILKEKYKVNEKFMKGLEKAPKSKKK